MLHAQPLTTLEHPLLLPYRTMKAQRDHHQQRIFVAEGEKIVQRLLDTPFTLISAVMPPKWLEILRPRLEARPELVEVFVAEKEDLERLTGFSMYQGVFAVAHIPNPTPLPEALDRSPRPWFLVAVDGINNSENLGALVRSCAAFGVHALLQGETSSSPYMRRAVRSSMGNIFWLPVVECFCLAHSLRYLKSRGVRLVAAHPHTDQRTLPQAQLAGDCCLVFGSEGSGLSPAVLDVCDEWVAIPMAPQVDSLNVGAAAAVFCYETARQRGAMGRNPQPLP
ncbi:MAG: RNA methyltransferase [Verrucomicrobiae bacterium]|nr:RNA methyltransferase [Verrucomicrobiae bacterium]